MRIKSAETTQAIGTGNLVILGGSGDVGQRLIRLLAAHAEWKIWSVSRRGPAVDTTHPNVAAITLDVASPEAANSLPEGAIFVNLTEATPPELVATILAKGGIVLDTSASPDYVDDQNRVAVGKTGRLITGVGTAPGLSTLMGADLARDGRVRTLRIGLELGMGRHFGQAAAEWFFRALGKPYDDPATGRATFPGTNPWRFKFAPTETPRMALDIGFPDAGIFPDGREESVRHYLAVDPRLVTRLIAATQRLGFGRWMARHSIRLTRLSRWLPQIGPTRTRIAAVAFDRDGKEIASHLFEGGDQADLTASMILLTVESICSSDAGQEGGNSIVDHLDLAQAVRGLARHFPETLSINTITRQSPN